jgi:hypothetical protein
MQFAQFALVFRFQSQPAVAACVSYSQPDGYAVALLGSAIRNTSCAGSCVRANFDAGVL